MLIWIRFCDFVGGGERNLDPTATLSSNPLSLPSSPLELAAGKAVRRGEGGGGELRFRLPCSGVEVLCCAGSVASSSGVGMVLRGVRACVCVLSCLGGARPAGVAVSTAGSSVLGAAKSRGDGPEARRFLPQTGRDRGLLSEARSGRRSRWPEVVWLGEVPPSAACSSRPRPRQFLVVVASLRSDGCLGFPDLDLFLALWPRGDSCGRWD
jgi:hypothetical protein